MKNIVFFLVLASLSAVSLADVEQSKTINVLAINDDGNVFVAVNNPQQSSSCSWSVLAVGNVSGSNGENVKAMYSLLMAVKLADRPVTIEFIGCEVNKVDLK